MGNLELHPKEIETKHGLRRQFVVDGWDKPLYMRSSYYSGLEKTTYEGDSLVFTASDNPDDSSDMFMVNLSKQTVISIEDGV